MPSIEKEEFAYIEDKKTPLEGDKIVEGALSACRSESADD